MKIQTRLFTCFVIISLLLGVIGVPALGVNAAVTAEAIVYVGSLGTAATKTSGTSLAITTSIAVSNGDDILVAVATDPNSSLVVSVSDAAGNSYSQVGSTVINSGNVRTYLFAAYDVNSMASGSAITVTSSPAVTARVAVAALFRGLDDSSPLDRTASATGSSNAPSSGASGTTAQADELLIGVVATEGPNGDAAGTWDGSFTAGPRLGSTGGTDDTNLTISLGYRIVSATGSYTASKTGITSRDWDAMIATFNAGPGTSPAIYTSGTPLSPFSSLPGGVSAEQTYSVSGNNLSGAVTVTAPADFQVSLSSGSGFTSSLVLTPSGGTLSATPIYVRFGRATEGTSNGSISHASSGATTRSVAVSGTAAPLNPVSFNILLGRPEDTSITANIIPDQGVEFYAEYGTASGVYGDQTSTYNASADQVVEFAIGELTANTRYYYRLVYRQSGTTEWNNAEEHSFMTQRAQGSSFVFTIISDSHLGQYGGQTEDEKALYAQTLQNVAGDNPDFHMDLGDTFAMDPSPLGTGMTVAEADAAYYVQRPYLAAITHSIPFLFVVGNHENEEGWNWDDTFTAPDQSLARVGIQARKKYFPNPIPDSFYTGNTDPLDVAIGGDTNREDYYAWTWGDALFVVIEPYHYSMVWPSEGGTYGGEGQDGEVGGDRWDWSLGIQQYLWLKSTLENSSATYKFVFSHHVAGGATVYGRGGISAAPYFEWGGKNADGTWGWDTNRPAAQGWTVPIHQLMVDNGVDVYFHGHDHIYAREELNGIVYLEVPKPDDAGYAWEPYGYGETENLYPDGLKIQNSGHIRVSISPAETKLEYVRAYLPGDGSNGVVADSVTVPGTPASTYTLSVTKPGSGSGTVTSDPAGINCGATCSASFDASTTVDLTAVAAAGSTFSGWGGACSGTDTCQVTMDAAKAVSAAFSLDNAAPTAEDDTYSTEIDVTMTIEAPGVLGNDSDGEGDALTARNASVPSHGAVTLNQDGSFTYTPESGYTGDDTFTYQAYDGVSYSSAATVTVHVLDEQLPITPSGFWGEIHISPGPSAGDYVEAYVPGVANYVKREAITGSDPLVYSIDVPGDIPATSMIEGGVEGDMVTFKINGSVVGTGTWDSGENVHLDFTTISHSIPLVAGWNLVSFNVHPTDTDIEAVLASVSGNFNLVYAWEAANVKWLKYDPGQPVGNSLKTLGESQGFWINMTSADTLTVNGSDPGTSNIALVNGWNLVGYPAHTNLAMPGALTSHGVSDLVLVYAYHAGDSDVWKKYDPQASFGNDLLEMAPGWGYWIQLGGAHTWDVSY
jgi:hypothetical protein